MIAVEGYVDVIAMTAAGFPHVVAPLGTALTPDQCELLWRMAPEPILCFDGDGAGPAGRLPGGRHGAAADRRRAAACASPSCPRARTLTTSPAAGGAPAIAEVLAEARPLVDVLWTARDRGQRRSTRRSGAPGSSGGSATWCRQIADETLRRHYGADAAGNASPP